MAYNLVTAGADLRQNFPGKVVFLGGRIRGRDWRPEMLHAFTESSVTFINPVRTSFPDPESQPEEHSNAVRWERDAIDRADIVVFWLGEGLSNQASRVEIGYAIGRGKHVLIGAEESFLGLEHLSSFAGVVLSSSVQGLNKRLESLLQAVGGKDEVLG